MNPSTDDGPDGSSIKPVSSPSRPVREHEPVNGRTTTPSQPSAPSTAPSRSISPAPKPDRLRSFKPLHEGAPVPPKTPIKAVPKPADLQVAERSGAPSEHEGPPIPSTRPAPTAKPRGLSAQPPALMVQPPQSPPKGRVSALTSGEHSPFLDPHSAAAPDMPGDSRSRSRSRAGPSPLSNRLWLPNPRGSPHRNPLAASTAPLWGSPQGQGGETRAAPTSATLGQACEHSSHGGELAAVCWRSIDQEAGLV
ncbi:hypothetical protein ACCO45_007270 [Purpureocillium lilacinum]|uniref:Uncharacterized protein n=1 Tax=Purpureocillium lilacinum TaxID=33203 RepID=A0ACC4DUY4_PURLI